MNIGYRGNATAFFNGDITYFKIETGGVTSVEYTFTEGSGSTLNDLLHPLTLVNNPTWDSAIVPLNVIGLKIGNKNAFRTFKNEELVFNLYNKLSTNTAPLAIKVGTAST